MIAYSTRIRPTWTLTAHGQLRAYQRGICRRDVLEAIRGPHYTRPSVYSGSRLAVITGCNGVVAVVDTAQRLIVTVYRRSSTRGADRRRNDKTPRPAGSRQSVAG